MKILGHEIKAVWKSVCAFAAFLVVLAEAIEKLHLSKMLGLATGVGGAAVMALWLLSFTYDKFGKPIEEDIITVFNHPPDLDRQDNAEAREGIQ